MRPRGRLERISLLNAGLLVVGWILGTTVAERWWPAAILTYLPQLPLGTATVLLLLAASLKRRGRAIVMNLAVLASFVVGPMGYQFRSPRQTQGSPFRVMTYNIHGGTYGVDGVVETIRREAPDVVCLQEAGLETPAASARLEAAIRKGLSGYEGRRYETLMLMTRRPLLAIQAGRLLEGRATRPMVEAIIEVDGTLVTVVDVHFLLSTPLSRIRSVGVRGYWRNAIDIRERQADQMLKELVGWDLPLVVCGDLNTPPRGRVYERLAGHGRDAVGEVGRGFCYTFPAYLPALRIDYVWLGPGVLANACRTPASRASDHLPVVVDLVIPRR